MKCERCGNEMEIENQCSNCGAVICIDCTETVIDEDDGICQTDHPVCKDCYNDGIR